MKFKISASLSVILICLVTLFSAGSVSAENASPEQKQKPGLYIWSRTDITSVKDEELAGVYRDADASLLDQIRAGLASREINVNVVKSEQDIAADPTRFVLLVKVDKIELGAKRPFGRTAKVKVSYSLQNKDRFEFVRRSHEETSTKRWQNCIKKISEQTVIDVASDIAKNSVPKKADDKQLKSKPTPTVKQEPAGSSTEARLQELENLKAKGLITEKEYEAKRKEILKEL